MDDTKKFTMEAYGVKCIYVPETPEDEQRFSEATRSLKMIEPFRKIDLKDVLVALCYNGLAKQVSAEMYKAIEKKKTKALLGMTACLASVYIVSEMDVSQTVENIVYATSAIGGIGDLVSFTRASLADRFTRKTIGRL